MQGRLFVAGMQLTILVVDAIQACIVWPLGTFELCPNRAHFQTLLKTMTRRPTARTRVSQVASRPWGLVASQTHPCVKRYQKVSFGNASLGKAPIFCPEVK